MKNGCVICKLNAKVPGFQLCEGCIAKFKLHIAMPEAKPFMDPPKPQPTPDIRGGKRDGSGVKIRKKKNKIAAAAQIPQTHYAG